LRASAGEIPCGAVGDVGVVGVVGEAGIPPLTRPVLCFCGGGELGRARPGYEKFTEFWLSVLSSFGVPLTTLLAAVEAGLLASLGVAGGAAAIDMRFGI